VLNCPEGCNLGTGCAHEHDMFEINAIMDEARQDVLQNYDNFDLNALYEKYDHTLQLNDFIRRYTPVNITHYTVTDEQIEHAFELLGKHTEIERQFDCSACGSDTCLDMVRRVACGLNIPENCIQKTRNDIHEEHGTVLDLAATSLRSIKEILEDISQIKQISDDIIPSVSGVNSAIEKYNKMATEIDKIAMHINIISLNASVEAARAGQYGKTFAVVAEEIRNLARTSKNTVSETEQIAEQSVNAIKVINIMIDQISTEIGKAYHNIFDISEKMQNTLDKSGLAAG